MAVGFALGGTVGLGTILYALSIGPLLQALMPSFTVRAPARRRRSHLEERPQDRRVVVLAPDELDRHVLLRRELRAQRMCARRVARDALGGERDDVRHPAATRASSQIEPGDDGRGSKPCSAQQPQAPLEARVRARAGDDEAILAEGVQRDFALEAAAGGHAASGRTSARAAASAAPARARARRRSRSRRRAAGSSSSRHRLPVVASEASTSIPGCCSRNAREQRRADLVARRGRAAEPQRAEHAVPGARGVSRTPRRRPASAEVAVGQQSAARPRSARRGASCA